MQEQPLYVNRRNLIKSSVFGLLTISTPQALSAFRPSRVGIGQPFFSGSFPNIDPEIVVTVVGSSHSDLEKVKSLVDPRPELARATWEWRFGDWESAIGAASHVGRRDIVHYLLEKGARPSIFTFAMLGAYEVVKSMIDYSPGIQRTMGPHGISLLQHAKTGSRMQDQMSAGEKDDLKRLIDYLESLGDADGPTYLEISPEDQEKYLGVYKYGTGSDEGFSIQLNRRKLISLAPIGGFGGTLYKTGDQKFTYNGTPSVTVSFAVEENEVQSLTIQEPGFSITAKKVS